MKITQWIILLLISTLTFQAVTQECTIKYDLQNIIQDQIVMYPNAQNGVISQSQMFPFPRTYFTSTPKILTSIDSYQVSSFSQFNYFLTVKVSRSSVNFTFTATDMQWSLVRVKFWLIARADILVGNFTLQNISSGSEKSFDIEIPQTFAPFVDEKSLQLNFVTGLKASTGGDLYEIDVKNSGRAPDGSSFKVTVSSLNQTIIQKIQVSYAIFNFQSSYFASGGGQISYKPISGAEYKKIHGSFSPIIYLIEGWDRIKLAKSGGFNLEFVFDTDYVLETYTGNKFDELGVVYLSIGRQPAGVCSCDQFIQRDGCVDSCPALTYPFIDYAKGGKSCLTCSPKFNQTINQFNTGCTCLQGLERVNQYCLPKSTLTECLQPNTVLSNGGCICTTGTQLINGKCQATCKANEVYNSATAKCECTFGYFNINGTCGVCSDDKVYDANFLACVCPQFQYIAQGNTCKCIPTYVNFTGTCVNKCPTGYTKSSGTCLPSQNCSANQVFQNGQCQCANNTYIVNGTCSTCPETTYYNLTSQTCINCMAFCQTCFNFSSCAQCKKDYFYNTAINQCVLNITCGNNQVLENGVCKCVGGSYEIGTGCGYCQQGTFYNSNLKTCASCVTNCLACSNNTFCTTCLPNYSFNSTLGYCAPKCGQNEAVVNGTCDCIASYHKINGVCSTCPSGQYYDSSSKTCLQCLPNCLTCSNSLICEKCILTHFYNTSTSQCEPSNCPPNQNIKDGKCNCIEGTYRIEGACGTCRTDEFYDPATMRCHQCASNCTRCLNQVMCGECEPYFRMVNNQCRFNLYDPKAGTPQFSESLIITDFTSSEPTKARQLSPQELKKIVQYQFDNSKMQPSQVLIQQNPKNTSEIRVIFSYCGFVPLEQFNVTYTFNDPSISKKEDIENVSYDVMKKGLTNYFAELKS